MSIILICRRNFHFQQAKPNPITHFRCCFHCMNVCLSLEPQYLVEPRAKCCIATSTTYAYHVFFSPIGTATFRKGISCKDAESYPDLHTASLRNKTLPFHYAHGGTISYSAARIYGHSPHLRKTHLHLEFSPPNNGCSPVQTERLQNECDNALNGGTTPTISTKHCKELSYPSSDSLASDVSEIATSF